MSRESFLPGLGSRSFFSRLPAPVIPGRKFVTELRSFMARQRRRRRFPLSFAAAVLARDANQGSIGDSRPMALWGCARGHSVAQRLFLDLPGHQPNPLPDTLPRRQTLQGSAEPLPRKRTVTAAKRRKFS